MRESSPIDSIWRDRSRGDSSLRKLIPGESSPRGSIQGEPSPRDLAGDKSSLQGRVSRVKVQWGKYGAK